MTDSNPTDPRSILSDLQTRHRAIEAGVADLVPDESQQECVELLRELVADTTTLLGDIDRLAVQTTQTSPSQESSEDVDTELQLVVGRLRGVLESIAEVRPSELFAGMDRRIGQLDRFQQDLQPVKAKIDELVQVVGGRHGYREYVEGFGHLNQRIKVLTGVVVVLAVVAVIAIFV